MSGFKNCLPMFGIAAGYGFLAGAIAAVTFMAMNILTAVVWRFDVYNSPAWYIVAVTLTAGVIISAINLRIPPGPSVLDGQVNGAEVVRAHHRSRLLWIGLGAVIAIVAGGSIGPEAGLVAIVGELSALIALRLGQKDSERAAENARTLTEAGNAAAFGVYGSPLGGGTWFMRGISPRTVANILAGLTGFLSFSLVMKQSGEMEHFPLGMLITVESRFTFDRLSYTLLAAVAGLVIGLIYVATHHILGAVRRLITNAFSGGGKRAASAQFWSGILFAAAMTALFVVYPETRFSGQGLFRTIWDSVDMITFEGAVLFVFMKILATTLTLAAGWRGGEFFPLVAIGAGVSVVFCQLWPGADMGTVALAVIGALTTVVIRKPIAIIAVVIFLSADLLYIPLLIGVGLGTIVISVPKIIAKLRAPSQS